MKQFLIDHIEKGISYSEYRNIVRKLVEENSTSGSERTEAMIEFTKLNDSRMKRWDKTLKVSEGHQSKIKMVDANITWLVISESWCGDAAHLLPVFNKIAELSENIDLKIVFRDENEELMDKFLTNGNRSIPKLIMIDSDHDVITTYGSRPEVLTNMVSDFKKEHGKLTDEFKQDLQVWYNKDKGQTIIEELVAVLCRLQPAICLETEM